MLSKYSMNKSNSQNSLVSKNFIKKFNQQVTLNDFNILINKRLKEFNGSSETTRAISFNQWLAGLIDAAGCFYISKLNCVSCELTLSGRELSALFKIKRVFGGSISKRLNTKSYRWRLHKKEQLINLLHALNGFIYLKVDVFKKVLSLFNIEFKSFDFSTNNAWLSGFFEGDGYININRSNFQIVFSVSQKNRTVLDLIQKHFHGHIIDDSWKGYTWYVSSKDDLIFLFEYFTLYPFYSNKNSDIITAKRFFRYKLQNYHLDTAKRSLLIHCIDLFQERKKI